MKAAVLREVGKPLQIENVQINKPGPHEVLIRTKAAGLCHSDLHFMQGSYPTALPAVLGHESAGIVEQVGSEVRSVKPGDHVITCLSAFCGRCEHCITGHLSLCVSPDTKREAGEEQRLQQPQMLGMVGRNDVGDSAGGCGCRPWWGICWRGFSSDRSPRATSPTRRSPMSWPRSA